MILFAILMLTLIFIITIGVTVVSAVGAVGIIVFGDVIVCVALILLLMRFIIKKKRK